MRYSRPTASCGPNRAAAPDDNRHMNPTDQDHPLLFQVLRCGSPTAGVTGIVTQARRRNTETLDPMLGPIDSGALTHLGQL